MKIRLLNENVQQINEDIQNNVLKNKSLLKKLNSTKAEINLLKTTKAPLEKELNPLLKKSDRDNKFYKRKPSEKVELLITVILYFIYVFLFRNGYAHFEEAPWWLLLIEMIVSIGLTKFLWRLAVRGNKTESKLINEKIKESGLLDLDQKLQKAENEKNSLEENIEYLSLIQEELENKTTIIQSIIALNKVYDTDDNNKLDIAETSSVELIIKSKQKVIRDIEKQENRDYLKDFLKIQIFLEGYQKQLVQDFNEIQNLYEVTSSNSIIIAKEKISSFKGDYNIYKSLISSLVLMITNLINDNLLDFYKLREIFDRLSIFENNYERKVANQLRNMTNLTSELIKITKESKEEIVGAMEAVGFSINDLEHSLLWIDTDN